LSKPVSCLRTKLDMGVCRMQFLLDITNLRISSRFYVVKQKPHDARIDSDSQASLS